MAGFNYEIDLVKDSETVKSNLCSRQVQETILREWDAVFREKIISLINQDENLKKTTEKTQFTLRISSLKGAVCEPVLLSEETLAEINKLYTEGGMTQEQVFRIELEEGRSRMLVPYNPLDYIQALTEEIALRVSLHEERLTRAWLKCPSRGCD